MDAQVEKLAMKSSLIVGAHSLIYSKNPEADRAFLKDVLELPYVDVGDGWLIFGLPPSEVAVHPSKKNDLHEFYLMCGNVEAFVTAMAARGLRCAAVRNQGWGLVTRVILPGGGTLGVYEPRHARPKESSGRAGRASRLDPAKAKRGKTRRR